MILPFVDLPYYQEFVSLADDARRVQIVQDYCGVLIKATDWTQVQFAPVDAALWRAYREEVRNYAKSYDPSNVEPVFPVVPQIILIGEEPNGN
jgi:hypothetical protein